MTEKQYSVEHNPFTQPNIFYDGHRFASVHFDDIYKVCDKLNELSEENEQLKSFIKRLCNKNGEIWLHNGFIYRVNKIFDEEWWKND